MSASGSILLTGATGFIGGRLVEALHEQTGLKIRALVHQFKNASRLARFPVQMVPGALRDGEAVARAMQGCDTVFHLAFGSRGSDAEMRADTVDGTRLMCEAALRFGVKRFVYTSTFSVYGETAPGDLTEQSPHQKSDDVYADAKLAAENVVRSFCRERGLPAIILQPTIVYGPYAYWSTWPIEQLRRGRVVLPSPGDGLCNAVYVDDVVRALLLAASMPGVEGETFLISGHAPSTWCEYYQGYAELITGAQVELLPLPRLSAAIKGAARGHPSILAKLERAATSPRLRREILSLPVLRALPEAWKTRVTTPPVAQAPSRPLSLPIAEHLPLFASRTRVRIDHAARRLGYEPVIGLADGLRQTATWARWARLLS